uniref:Ubiquitin-like protease family profile domain-containing protein n=1 Tax=Tetranychus urticae TaxID=32264 RepID=T1JYF4_TETUR
MEVKTKKKRKKYEMVREIVTKIEWPSPISDYDLMLFPTHRDLHWMLIVLDNRDKTVHYYDTIKSDNPPILEDYKVMIKHCHPEFALKFMNHTNIPQQSDQDSCGPFVCNYGAMIVFHYLTGLPEFDIQHHKTFNKAITNYQPESDAEKSSDNVTSRTSRYKALVKRKREEHAKETAKRPNEIVDQTVVDNNQANNSQNSEKSHQPLEVPEFQNANVAENQQSAETNTDNDAVPSEIVDEAVVDNKQKIASQNFTLHYQCPYPPCKYIVLARLKSRMNAHLNPLPKKMKTGQIVIKPPRCKHRAKLETPTSDGKYWNNKRPFLEILVPIKNDQSESDDFDGK